MKTAFFSSTDCLSRNQSGARPVPGRSAWGGKRAAEHADDLRTASALTTRCARARPVPVPEGRRRRLAGGKSAPADAAPGDGAAWLRAPAGHRRNRPAATSAGGKAAGWTPPKTSSMPRWGMARSAAQPGAALAARTCPRLISCGVPPGQRAKRWSQFLRCELTAKAAEKSVPAARILRSHGRPVQPAANQITPVPPRPERPLRDQSFGIFRRSSPPSRSAFLPISAVFHSAPPRSERFLKTPQRSEGTQSGKGRKRAYHVLTGLSESCIHPCRPARAALVAAPPPCVPRIPVVLTALATALPRLTTRAAQPPFPSVSIRVHPWLKIGS